MRRGHIIVLMLVAMIISSSIGIIAGTYQQQKKVQDESQLPILSEGKNIIDICDKRDLAFRMDLDINSTYLIVFDSQLVGIINLNFKISIYTYYDTYNYFEQKYEKEKNEIYSQNFFLGWAVERYQNFTIINTYEANKDACQAGYYMMVDIYGWSGPTGSLAAKIIVYIEKLLEGSESISGEKRFEWNLAEYPYRIFRFDLDSGVYRITFSQDVIYNGTDNFVYGYVLIDVSWENIISEKYLKVFLNGYLIGTTYITTGSDSTSLTFDIGPDQAKYLSYMNEIRFECYLEQDEKISVYQTSITLYSIDKVSHSFYNDTCIELNSTNISASHFIAIQRNQASVRYVLFDDIVPYEYYDGILVGSDIRTITVYKAPQNNIYLLAIPIVKGEIELNITVDKLSVANYTGGGIEVEVNENDTEKFVIFDAEDAIWKIEMQYVSGTNWTVDLNVWDLDGTYGINRIDAGANITIDYNWTKMFIYRRENKYTRFPNEIADIFAISYNFITQTMATIDVTSYFSGVDDIVILQVKGVRKTNASDKFVLKIASEKISDIAEDIDFEVSASEPGLFAVKMPVENLLYKIDIKLNNTVKTKIYARNSETFSDIYDEIKDNADGAYMEIVEDMNYLLDMDENLDKNISAFLPVIGTSELVLLFRYTKDTYFKINGTHVNPIGPHGFAADNIIKLLEVELPEISADVCIKSSDTLALVYFVVKNGTSAIYGTSIYLYPNLVQQVAVKYSGKAYVFLIPSGYESNVSLVIERSSQLEQYEGHILVYGIKLWLPIGVIIGVGVYTITTIVRTMRRKE